MSHAKELNIMELTSAGQFKNALFQYLSTIKTPTFTTCSASQGNSWLCLFFFYKYTLLINLLENKSSNAFVFVEERCFNLLNEVSGPKCKLGGEGRFRKMLSCCILLPWSVFDSFAAKCLFSCWNDLLK